MRSRKTAKPGGRTRFRGGILGDFDPSAHLGSPPLLPSPLASLASSVPSFVESHSSLDSQAIQYSLPDSAVLKVDWMRAPHETNQLLSSVF